jgi:mono/diheme cytochrome c family protein
MPTPAFPLMIRTVFGLLAMLLVASVQANAAADDWWKVAHRLAPATTLDFTPHGTQPGLSLDLLFADQCFSCHAANQGDPATAFRPYTAWAGSMKANATRDPLFFAALDVANNDVPGAGDYCLRCHTARGWLGGHVVKAGFGAPNNDVTLGAAGCLLGGAYDSADDLDSDFGGVTCHFCHRLMAQGPNGEAGYLENDNAWVDDVSCTNPVGGGGGPCRHGPYDYLLGPPVPPHEWVYSDYHTQSAICGLCHNVTSPDTNAGPLKFLKLNDGTPTTLPFPIERTFAEWQQSQYAQAPQQTCQACHMPDSEDPNATACALPGYPNRTGDLPVHAFVGGNTWIPGIIKGQYAAGIVANGGSDRSASYDQTITWARQLLGTAAAVATTIPGYTPPTGGNAGSMTVNVKITNLSGHKLPSGYSEGRRMWLNLQVHDANGSLVFESAAYNPASGVLSADAQARVYEVLQGIFNHNGTGTCDVVDAAGKPMFHFVASDCIAKDTRIPPLGFHPATAHDPNGYALRPVPVGYYPGTTPGTLVNFDSVNYALPVPAGTVGPLTATARLYYQTSSKDYMEFLRDEAIANGTEGENQMCSGQADRPFTVGPQGLTRGEYVYQLWNQPTAQDRVFADGFDGTAAPTGSGKSPPELIQSGSATTP